MNLLESIHELTKTEKIKVMEFLWEELTCKEEEYSAPKWHENSLRETENRVAEGKERFIDWNEAKQLLRTEFK